MRPARSSRHSRENTRVVRATWNGQVLAEAADTENVDGYTYFPREAVRWEFLAPSTTTTVCSWKGTASYYNVVVDGQTNADAAWSYQSPKPEAAGIKDMIGFWRGVTITR
jgi:uncharacterized protein (DUF427 family)